MIKILINKTGSTKVSISTTQKASLQGLSTNQSIATLRINYLCIPQIIHTQTGIYITLI